MVLFGGRGVEAPILCLWAWGFFLISLRIHVVIALRSTLYKRWAGQRGAVPSPK